MAIDTYKSKSTLAALFIVLMLSLFALTQAVFAQSPSGSSDSSSDSSTGSASSGTSTAGGPVASNSSANTDSTVLDSNQGTPAYIEGTFLQRHLNAKTFAETQWGGSDVVVNGQSTGPGSVVHGPGPVQLWPAVIPTATSAVPTFRDQGITQHLFQTFGYPVSDTQFQIISRYNDNIFMEQLFNPERVMWLMGAMGNIQATNTANSAANLTQNQGASAIQHIQVFLVNFTNEAADPGNMWHSIRNNLFVPMAILLLFLGAVIAQVVAIVAQGTSVLGNISPFDGIQRSVIAVFLIPFTQLAMSWGIDVSNSIAQSIPTAYFTQFGRDMYQDAQCSIQRAFPINSQNNMNAMIPFNSTAGTASGTLEGLDFDITGGWNPCMTGSTTGTGTPDEAEQFVTAASRLMANSGNATLAMTWNVLCAFQTAYLYYLWCMGPIVAALWVWPMQQLRNALPSWIDGLITLCFWSLFWNTSVLLMACFYGVNTNGDTGTMYVSALMLLSNLCVKFAFNFSGLTTSLGFMAESMMMSAAGSAGGAGHGGGQQGAGQGASHGGMGGQGAFAHGGAFGGHGVGAGAFVPGQGGGAEVAGGAVAGAGAGAVAGVGAGAASPVGSSGLGGVLAGTGFGTGLGSAAHEAVLAGGNLSGATIGGLEVGGAGAATIAASTGGADFGVTGSSGAGITPALSGTGAPGGFNAVGNASSVAGLSSAMDGSTYGTGLTPISGDASLSNTGLSGMTVGDLTSVGTTGMIVGDASQVPLTGSGSNLGIPGAAIAGSDDLSVGIPGVPGSVPLTADNQFVPGADFTNIPGILPANAPPIDQGGPDQLILSPGAPGFGGEVIPASFQPGADTVLPTNASFTPDGSMPGGPPLMSDQPAGAALDPYANPSVSGQTYAYDAGASYAQPAGAPDTVIQAGAPGSIDYSTQYTANYDGANYGGSTYVQPTASVDANVQQQPTQYYASTPDAAYSSGLPAQPASPEYVTPQYVSYEQPAAPAPYYDAGAQQAFVVQQQQDAAAAQQQTYIQQQQDAVTAQQQTYIQQQQDAVTAQQQAYIQQQQDAAAAQQQIYTDVQQQQAQYASTSDAGYSSGLAAQPAPPESQVYSAPPSEQTFIMAQPEIIAPPTYSYEAPTPQIVEVQPPPQPEFHIEATPEQVIAPPPAPVVHPSTMDIGVGGALATGALAQVMARAAASKAQASTSPIREVEEAHQEQEQKVTQSLQQQMSASQQFRRKIRKPGEPPPPFIST
jgi:hypothetical protein